MKKYIWLILFLLVPSAASEKDILTNFLKVVTITSSVAQKLQELAHDEPVTIPRNDHITKLSIVRAYPGLSGALPYVELGVMPTPVVQLATLGKKLGLSSLYLKHDDKLAKPGHFDGNKVRKLPLLLGDALAHKAPAVITMGAAGSNHALATADYAQSLGLPAHLFLIPQIKNIAIQRNLLWGFARDADLMLCPTKELRDNMLIATMLRYKQTTGLYPYFIPGGGSCPLGTVGFVDAAFELREQIARGELPEPAYIYVTLGSGGTVAGLLLGLKAAGLKSRIRAVTIEPQEKKAWYDKVINLAKSTNDLLCKADPTFPACDIGEQDFDLLMDFAGDRYAQPTTAGRDAQALLKATQRIELDTTYTAKTFAALINDAQTGRIASQTSILFWHTYCADPLPADAQTIDYHQLPVALHSYFNQDVPKS